MKGNKQTILMVGCFDTKEEDFFFLHECLIREGLIVRTMNLGIYREPTSFEADVTADEVAIAAGTSAESLRQKGDRNLVVEQMGLGASKIASQLASENQISAAIGMGGGGGTYMVLKAMQGLPIGMPKVCLSTVATKDLSRQVGPSDVTLMPSLVDIAGLNRISRMQMHQAAGALRGMLNVSLSDKHEEKPCIAISMFGNTTQCVAHCTALLESKGYEAIAFHAVGSGGRTMESLIAEGFFDGVLDITTTELADELCEGICSAGPDRLKAAAIHGIPQVVVPGCLDMVNYGHLDTVPARFKDRLLFSWAPDVTLMRTNAAENELLGHIIAERLNSAIGKVAILFPLKGISIISAEGQDFYDPETDAVLFETIKEKINDDIPVRNVNAHINDEHFAQEIVNQLLAFLDH